MNFFEVLFLIHIDNSANTAKVMVAHHKVSLSIRQLKRVFKKMGLSRRTPKRSVNDVLTFVLNELESSSRCLRYRAMHQKLLMNGFIIDHESVR